MPQHLDIRGNICPRKVSTLDSEGHVREVRCLEEGELLERQREDPERYVAAMVKHLEGGLRFEVLAYVNTECTSSVSGQKLPGSRFQFKSFLMI